MRSLCRSVAYVPGIGTGWRGLVSRENADGWPWRALPTTSLPEGVDLPACAPAPLGIEAECPLRSPVDFPGATALVAYSPRPWREAERPNYCAIAGQFSCSSCAVRLSAHVEAC